MVEVQQHWRTPIARRSASCRSLRMRGIDSIEDIQPMSRSAPESFRASPMPLKAPPTSTLSPTKCQILPPLSVKRRPLAVGSDIMRVDPLGHPKLRCRQHDHLLSPAVVPNISNLCYWKQNTNMLVHPIPKNFAVCSRQR